MGDSPRDPDSRGVAGESGVEQTSAETPDIRSSEEGGQPDSGADTSDIEGAALGGVE